MKTTKSQTWMKSLAFTALALFLFFTSCKDNDTVDYTSDDNSSLQGEANSDAHLEEASDMSAVAMSADAGTLTGRTSENSGSQKNIKDLITDTRFTCATVVLEFATDNEPAIPGQFVGNPHGYITIDFGAGCTGPNGRVRKGKIIIEFKGRRFTIGSFFKVTFEGYSVDGIKIEGTRTETNITESNDAPKFQIEEVDSKVTFLDLTFATRTISKVRQWNRAALPENDSWTVTGSAFGLNRKGNEYTMTITKALVFKRKCAIESKVVIPVEGTKELVTKKSATDSKKVTIDFGNGTCDTKVTITVNGRSKEIEVSKDGN